MSSPDEMLVYFDFVSIHSSRSSLRIARYFAPNQREPSVSLDSVTHQLSLSNGVLHQVELFDFFLLCIKFPDLVNEPLPISCEWSWYLRPLGLLSQGCKSFSNLLPSSSNIDIYKLLLTAEFEVLSTQIGTKIVATFSRCQNYRGHLHIL